MARLAQEEWRGVVEQISWEPRAFLFKKFLSDDECDHLVNHVRLAALNRVLGLRGLGLSRRLYSEASLVLRWRETLSSGPFSGFLSVKNVQILFRQVKGPLLRQPGC